MSMVYGLFDDDDAVRKALEALERLGKGDEVVEVITQPDEVEGDIVDRDRTTEAPVVATPLIPVAGGIPGAVTTPVGMPLRYRSLEDIGEVGEYFSRAVGKGGQVVIIDSPDPEAVAGILKEAGAERVYDKKSGRDV